MTTLNITNYRKSTRSGNQANCVEVGSGESFVAVRDSKDAAGPVIVVEDGAWAAFLAAAKTGAFVQTA